MLLLCHDCGRRYEAPTDDNGEHQLSPDTVTLIRGTETRWRLTCGNCGDGLLP